MKRLTANMQYRNASANGQAALGRFDAGMPRRSAGAGPVLGLVVILSATALGWTQGALANLAIMMPLLVAVLAGQFFSALNSRGLSLLMLLLVALVVHQVPLILHDLTPFYQGVKAIVLGLFAYAGGFVLVGLFRDRPMTLTMVLIAGSSGFVGLSIVSAVYSGFPLETLLLPGYAVNPIAHVAMHKTHIGMFSSLGMCLLPAVLFWWPAGWRARLVWLLLLLLVVAGFAANMALQNRTPVIAMCLVLVVGLAIHLKETVSKRRSVLWFYGVLVFLTALAVGATWAISIWWDTVKVTAFAAFDRAALATPRYMVWQAMFEHFTDHFWGGRLIRLPERYAHDLWLDVLWDSGLPAFFAWVMFHLLHLVYLVRVLARPIDKLLRWVLLGTVGSVYLSALVEPVVGASLFYFWLGLLVLGVVARLADEPTAALAGDTPNPALPVPGAGTMRARVPQFRGRR